MKRAVLAAIGLAGMGFAVLSLLDLDMTGFPDGYVSPYDRATLMWVTGIAYALLLGGIFTLAAAAMSKPRRATVGAVLAGMLALSLWLIDTCPRLDWCTLAVQQLTGIMVDDGTGG